MIGYVYSFARFDFYVPQIRAVHPGMYHVFPSEELLLFSDVVHVLLFSGARIGGMIDNNDMAIRANQGVAAFARLCETGGLDMSTALVDASRKQLIEVLKEPTSEIKHMFKPLVDVVKKKEKNFVVRYSLNAHEIALLQKSFPELNVIVTGQVNHPHAMAAVTRDCSEELILRFIHYSVSVKSLINGKDIYLVDIGANYIRHIKYNRFNVHCCNPIIDFRDSGRETERRNQLLDD